MAESDDDEGLPELSEDDDSDDASARNQAMEDAKKLAWETVLESMNKAVGESERWEWRISVVM